MSARSRLLLDVGMLTALLTTYTPSATGVTIHEWLGIAVIVPLLVHLVINWEWTVNIATRLFERIRNASRLNLVVDTLLFASAAAVMLSGLMISKVALPAIGLSVTPTAAWIALHSVTADTTIALLLAHFALHFSWAARTLGMLGAKTHAQPTSRPAAAPARARAANRSLKNTGAVLLATGLTVAAIFAGVGLSGTSGTTTTVAATTATTSAATSADAATASDNAANVTTASNASSSLLVCPATGCTETYCHATTGQRPGH